MKRLMGSAIFGTIRRNQKMEKLQILIFPAVTFATLACGIILYESCNLIIKLF